MSMNLKFYMNQEISQRNGLPKMNRENISDSVTVTYLLKSSFQNPQTQISLPENSPKYLSDTIHKVFQKIEKVIFNSSSESLQSSYKNPMKIY